MPGNKFNGKDGGGGRIRLRYRAARVSARSADLAPARTYGSHPLAPFTYQKSPSDGLFGKWWRRQDSNLRRDNPADLQSAAFDRSATPPAGCI